MLCSFSGARSAGEPRPEPEAPEETSELIPEPEPLTAPVTEPPTEPDKGSAIANSLRRQRIAAEKASGLDLPGNAPACIQWMTTSVSSEAGSTVSVTGEILDSYGNVTALLSGAEPALCTLCEYSEDGQILRQYSIAGGTVMSYREYTYREDGSLSASVLFSLDENGEYPPSRYAEYDSGGNLTSEGYCYSGGRTSSKIASNEYTPEGQLSVIRSYQGGTETSCERLTYSHSGRLTGTQTAYSGERLIAKETAEYTYLTGGALRQMTRRSYLRDGTLYSVLTREYTYDETGRITSETTRQSGGGTVITKTYTYEEL